MSKKSNSNGPVPFEEPPFRMSPWLEELKELCSRCAEISAENEGEPHVTDPIHEKGHD
jgi:hypothetical protein